MASPQIEDGYTKIADELMEVLARRHLGNYEWRCLLFIIRKTYGFNKKDDWISLSQFVDATGLQRSHICRSLKMLIQQNIITKGGNASAPRYAFQKDYEKWLLLPKGVRKHSPNITKGGTTTLPKGARAKGGNHGVPKGVIEGVPKGAHTKDTITKDTITKEIPTATNVADPISKSTREKKDPNELIDLNEFLRQSRLSSRRDINIIADWAEANPPPCTTRGQWSVYIKRHLRAAQALAPFTEDQINTGFTKMRAAEYIDKPTLETLLKFIT